MYLELVQRLNDPYAQEWNQMNNYFRPTFELLRRDKRGGKPVRSSAKESKTLANDR